MVYITILHIHKQDDIYDIFKTINLHVYELASNFESIEMISMKFCTIYLIYHQLFNHNIKVIQ